MFLEVGGAIECQMLGKVRQPLLIVVFQNRPGLDYQTQFQFLFRLAIFLDVIRQAIGQFPHLDLRADRDRVAQVEGGARASGQHAQNGGSANAVYKVVGHRGWALSRRVVNSTLSHR